MSAAALNGGRLSYKEKMARSQRVARFLASGDADGMTVREVAQAVGVTPLTVSRHVRKARIPTSPGGSIRALPRRVLAPVPPAEPGTPWALIEAFAAAHPGPHTAARIAAGTGLAEDEVRRAMADHGLPVLPAGDLVPAGSSSPAVRRDVPRLDTLDAELVGAVHYAGTTLSGLITAREAGTDHLWVMVPAYRL